MSKTNSVSEALDAYLVNKGLAEAQPGYGHATGEEVAQAVVLWLDRAYPGWNGTQYGEVVLRSEER